MSRALAPHSQPGCVPPIGKHSGCAPVRLRWARRHTPTSAPPKRCRRDDCRRHRLCGGCPQVPAVGERLPCDAGPASASRMSSTTRLPTSPRHWFPGHTNAFGILHHWYGPGRGRPTSAPGRLVQVVAHDVDGSVVTIASDGSWRARPAE